MLTVVRPVLTTPSGQPGQPLVLTQAQLAQLQQSGILKMAANAGNNSRPAAAPMASPVVTSASNAIGLGVAGKPIVIKGPFTYDLHRMLELLIHLSLQHSSNLSAFGDPPPHTHRRWMLYVYDPLDRTGDGDADDESAAGERQADGAAGRPGGSGGGFERQSR